MTSVGDRPRFLGGLAAVVGALALVEVTSGILQGFYTPILTDIARHFGVHDADVNWLEAAQLMFSAVAVPVLAKLGDSRGHRGVLLSATAVTALASYALAVAPTFATFLIAWALQGAYVVWLPLEVAIIYLAARRAQGADGSTDAPAMTRRAAGLLVAALETGVIVGALTSGALAEALPLPVLLLAPAGAVTLCLVVIRLLVPADAPQVRGAIDTGGVVGLTLSLVLLTFGLSLLRTLGAADVLPWLLIGAAVVALVPFARHELRSPDPLIDLRMLASRRMWPIQLTAGLFGVSVLGAQAPLSTFARTDPQATGYGLGLGAGQVSIIIGAYVLSMLVGALLLAPVSRWTSARTALVLASVLVAVGYSMFLPLHDSLAQTLTNMIVAGVGSGALVAALPSAAAAAAAANRTGMATGMTNMTKTLGGAIASAVFGVALFRGVSEAAVEAGRTAAPLSGYLTVWALCGITAAVCAGLLMMVPRGSFEDASRLAGGAPIPHSR